MSDEPGEPIVLRWDCTFDDHVVVQRRLMGRVLGQRAFIWVGAVLVVCASMVWLGGRFTEWIAALAAAIWSAAVLGALWVAPRRAVSRQRKAGLLPLGPMSLALDAGGVWWQQEGSQSRLGWGAVRSVDVDRRGLWVALSTGVQLRAPARALAGWDAGRVAAWRESPGPPGEIAPPTDAVHVVRGVLTPDVWASALSLGTRALRGRVWPRLVLFLALYALILVLFESLGADPTLARAVYAALSIGVTLTSLLVLPRLLEWRRARNLRKNPSRVPLGDVDARLGPRGVWIRTPVGTSAFTWSWITSVAQDDRAVALVVGLGSVVALPADALADRDRVVADCRSWIAGAPRLRSGEPRPGRGTARDVGNAFAPPD